MINKLATIVAFVAIIMIVISAFSLRQCGRQKMVLNSPDNQRVQDILSLSWRIVVHAQRTGQLPGSLSELGSDGWKIPADPLTSAPYFYKKLGDDSFRLCADFASASKSGAKLGVKYGDPVVHTFGYWIHGQGVQCLDRSVPRMTR